jgi:hypothetical protein
VSEHAEEEGEDDDASLTETASGTSADGGAFRRARDSVAAMDDAVDDAEEENRDPSSSSEAKTKTPLPPRLPEYAEPRDPDASPRASSRTGDSLAKLAGDGEAYAKLRETMGVEEAMTTPLKELLAPVEDDAERGRDDEDRARLDAFAPYEDMPRGLMLPYQGFDGYGQPKSAGGVWAERDAGQSP